MFERSENVAITHFFEFEQLLLAAVRGVAYTRVGSKFSQLSTICACALY
jgi:hypothetical protein